MELTTRTEPETLWIIGAKAKKLSLADCYFARDTLRVTHNIFLDICRVQDERFAVPGLKEQNQICLQGLHRYLPKVVHLLAMRLTPKLPDKFDNLNCLAAISFASDILPSCPFLNSLFLSQLRLGFKIANFKEMDKA